MSAYLEPVTMEPSHTISIPPTIASLPPAFLFGNDPHLLAWGHSGLAPGATEHGDSDRVREQAWSRVVAAAGADAAILLLVQPSDHGSGHAFLIGFDPLRNAPARTNDLLAAARSVLERRSAIATRQLVTVTLAQEPHLADLSDLDGFARAGIVTWKSPLGGMLKVLLFQRDGGLHGNGFDRRVLESSLPLMHASIEAFIQSTRSERRSALFEGLLDTMSTAIVLLNDHCRILYRNAAAGTMIAEGKGLIVTREGELRCKLPTATKALLTSVGEVVRRSLTSPEAPIVIRIADEELLLGFVTSAMSRSGGQANRCAMLMIPPPRSGELGREVMAALGLLPCEQRFLRAFLSTASLLEAANKAGVSEETARTYLKRIRSKLGVHRQMELVQLLGGLVPPLRQNGDALAMLG